MAIVEQPYPHAASLGSRSAAALRSVAQWLRFRLAWLAGADMRLLQQVPGEKPFHDRLGALVLAITSLSGVAMSYLAAVVSGQPIGHVWFIGLIWWLLLLNLEPLILDIAATSGRGLLVVVPLRLLVTLVLAGIFSEAILIGVFKPEIQNVLGQHDVAAIEKTQTVTAAFYESKINAAQREITKIENSESALEGKITHYTFLAGCEKGLTRCSQTHELGCGPYCERDLRIAGAAKGELNQIKPRDTSRVRSLNAQVTTWQNAEQAIPASRGEEISGGNGLIKREEALWKIEIHSGVAAVEIWGLRAALVIFDFLALALKLGHLPGSPYKEYAEASRRREGLAAFEIASEAEVRRESTRLTAQMQIEVDRARIEGEAIRRVAEEEAKWWPPTDGGVDEVHAGTAAE